MWGNVSSTREEKNQLPFKMFLRDLWLIRYNKSIIAVPQAIIIRWISANFVFDVVKNWFFLGRKLEKEESNDLSSRKYHQVIAPQVTVHVDTNMFTKVEFFIHNFHNLSCSPPAIIQTLVSLLDAVHEHFFLKMETFFFYP